MTYHGTGRTRAVTAPTAAAPASTSDDVAVAIPETDIHRIQLWCRERVPKHLWPQVKVEADVEPRHVTIVELRPPWNGVGDHTRFPIARLRYTSSTGLWAIYWRDRNLKFHEYDRKRRPRTSMRSSTTSPTAATRSSGASTPAARG
jgi:Protein of unknown function (DUF3024)